MTVSHCAVRCALVILFMSGCAQTQEGKEVQNEMIKVGAVSGAAGGAARGLIRGIFDGDIIGNTLGEAAIGAAGGTVAGAVVGGIYGDDVAQNSQQELAEKERYQRELEEQNKRIQQLEKVLENQSADNKTPLSANPV